MLSRVLRSRPYRPDRRSALRLAGWLVLAAITLGGAGCGPRNATDELDSTRAWELLELPQAKIPLSPNLNILIWENYLPPAVIARFETTYGVKVRVTFFSENEELHARLVRGERYDMIMPSTYMVQQLIRENRLRALDRTGIPNFQYVDEGFFHLRHDPGLKYSVPFFQETAGIVFNAKYAWGLPMTWPAFARETGTPLARGRLSVIDEMRTTMGTALLMLGLDPNSHDPSDIAKARDLLISAKRETGLQFQLDDEPQLLISEKIILGTAWSGDATKALAFNGDVRFIVPRGNSISEIDSYCVPANAVQAATAEFFINFLLTPEISAALTNYSYYANTCSQSRAFISPVILNGPAYMQPLPNSAVFLQDVQDALHYYEAAWKAAHDAPEPNIVPEPLPFPRTASRSAR